MNYFDCHQYANFLVLNSCFANARCNTHSNCNNNSSYFCRNSSSTFRELNSRNLFMEGSHHCKVTTRPSQLKQVLLDPLCTQELSPSHQAQRLLIFTPEEVWKDWTRKLRSWFMSLGYTSKKRYLKYFNLMLLYCCNHNVHRMCKSSLF